MQVRGSEVGTSAFDLAVSLPAITAGLILLEENTRHASFEQGSALELPFDAESFDVVWTEHAQMNIGDKEHLYGEISRVLAPGGRLAFHDIYQGVGGAPYYPTPLAEDSSISSLVAQTEARAVIEKYAAPVRD